MEKNKIIVVNPTTINMMKAICNAIVSNILEIIIIGNRDIIKQLCERINISINLLRLIHCNNEKEMIFKLKQYQEKTKIDGIIIDELKDYKYKELLECDYLCHIIDFGVFKKSVFILNNNHKCDINKNINQIIELVNQFDVKKINIGIVSYDKEKAITTRKLVKNTFKNINVDIIDFEKIKKGNYNIIIFDTKQLKQVFINQINELTLPRVIEINKASNLLVFDAKGKKLKNIFFEFLIFSKLGQLSNEFDTQVI